MRVLIAGCGYVGTELGAQLVRAGHVAWGLRRRPRRFPPGLEPLAADLHDPRTLLALPPDLDAVVYATGAEAAGVIAYRAAYVEGPQRLVDALVAQRQAPRVFVFVSSTGVYAQRTGEWVDENTPTEPVEPSAQVLLEGEGVVRTAPWRTVVLRLGGIYGPGRTTIVESVRAGRATIPAGEPVWTNRIHRDDAAGAVAHLCALPDPAPLYVGVDTEPATLETVFTWLAARLHAAAPRRGGPPDATAGRGNKRCSSALLRASGYVFRYPTFREGYEALIA